MKRIVTFSQGTNSTSIWVYESRFHGVFVHSDGVNWTATHDIIPRLPKAETFGGTMYRASSTASMPVEAQAMLAWSIDLKLHTQPVGSTKSMPRPEMESVVSDVIGGTSIVYAGYSKKVGEYAFAKIREIVTKAVKLCLETWGWAPETIRLSVHAPTRAMGLAFMPGTLDATKTRRVSLSRALFQKYDANAIHRVIVHELCHHWREERWPRQMSGRGSKERRRSEAHDTRFCEELQRVDPIVAASPSSCTFFEEQADPTIAVAAAQKREAGVVWSPDAGTIVMSRLKSGKTKWAWEPKRQGAWARYGDWFNDDSLLALLQRFSPAQWKDVRVAPFWRPGIESLADLVTKYLAAFPRTYFEETAKYIESLAPSA